MSKNYRCTKSSCRQRRTLKRPIEQYVREPRCLACGGRLSYDPEPKRRHNQEKCVCDGYHFPHRRGTEPWCRYAKKGPSDKDYEERYGSSY
jgi:hypothetical protein